MAHVRETAQFHTVAFSLIKRDDAPDVRMHTLYLLRPEGAPLPFEPLLDYFHHTGRAKSLAWQKEVAYSVGLFIDFIAAQDRKARLAATTATTATTLFSNFAMALTRGTIGRDGIDPLGLYWEPKSAARASKLLSSVTLFSDCSHARLGAQQVNPWRNADFAQRMAAMRAIDKRAPHQLLGYLGSAQQKNEWSSQVRSVGVDRKPAISTPVASCVAISFATRKSR